MSTSLLSYNASNFIDVSVILPVYNSELWLEECLESILKQDFKGIVEVSVFNDASTDKSEEILRNFCYKFKEAGMQFILTTSDVLEPKGVGFAKNQAVKKSSGKYLCFLDSDDVMHPNRIKKQYSTCISTNDAVYNLQFVVNNRMVADDKPGKYGIIMEFCKTGIITEIQIIGCRFHRKPDDSTPRYTQWANNLTPHQLYCQIYTAFGPTVVMPTWFCHRDVFNKVGGFSEKGKGTPEDLIFFYSHLRMGGKLKKVEEELLLYRYHPAATTFSVSEETVWNIRLEELEKNVLCHWSQFTIWNAGKQGRKFYRCLSLENKLKVKAFCDVDEKKITKGVYIYEESKILPKPRIPIIHFTNAKPPFILCVKIDMTGGNFEKNLSSLNLIEGRDYYHFS